MCEHTIHGRCFVCESIRLDDILDKLRGIGLQNVQLALPAGDVGQTCEDEFHAWLNTAEGRFAVYRAERGAR